EKLMPRPKSKLRELILNEIIEEQKKTLENLGVKFDRFFYERDLHEKQKVKWAVEKLHELGKTFEENGALWFKSQEFGDDKNRVLIREDGQPTYFAADIAYHLDKFSRNYDRLINIWGADHHGYVARLRAALKALGQPEDKLEVFIGQLVTLYRGKEPVRMSKRTGQMITLQEVIDEIGADATRFFFAATDVNSHLDFDLELAKKKSHENPVFYVQYAHARICSILRKAAGEMPKSDNLFSLEHPAERELMVKILSWPEVVLTAARLRHPHRLAEYGKELATVFHYFYEQCKVLGNPARLVLANATRITLRNVLKLLGISAPEKM
ncbi:MAG: arginine--tRNA ligase, partial [Candidatus Margulisiibacteriota bacterium]